MTRTLDSIAFNILTLLREGRVTEGEPITLRQIKYNIEYYRALLIKRDHQRRDRTLELEQSLGLVQIEQHDSSESKMGISSMLTMRTVNAIPNTLRLGNNQHGITSVSTPDNNVQYPVIDHYEGSFVKYSKYTSSDPRAFLLDGHMHVVLHPVTEHIHALRDGNESTLTLDSMLQHPMYIRIRGVFEQPKEAWEFANEGKTWDDAVNAYPLPLDLEQRIASGLMQNELKMLATRETDLEADGLPE